MVTISEVAKEVSILVPKLITGMRGNFMSQEKITAQQMITILQLNELTTSSVSTLAKRMSVSNPTMSGIIDRLVNAGYINRIRDKKDRRIVFLSLTHKGSSFVKKFLKTLQKRWAQALSYLTQEEREAYVRILKKLITALAKEKME